MSVRRCDSPSTGFSSFGDSGLSARESCDASLQTIVDSCFEVSSSSFKVFFSGKSPWLDPSEWSLLTSIPGDISIPFIAAASTKSDSKVSKLLSCDSSIVGFVSLVLSNSASLTSDSVSLSAKFPSSWVNNRSLSELLTSAGCKLSNKFVDMSSSVWKFRSIWTWSRAAKLSSLPFVDNVSVVSLFWAVSSALASFSQVFSLPVSWMVSSSVTSEADPFFCASSASKRTRIFIGTFRFSRVA